MDETNKETGENISEVPSEPTRDLWQPQCIEKKQSFEELTVHIPGLAA